MLSLANRHCRVEKLVFTIDDSNLRLERSCLEDWAHDHWQVLLKVLSKNLAHSCPRADHVGNLGTKK